MEWTKEKIEQLILNQEQEYYNLEYKGAGALENTDANKKEISKDVSAMANSAGGTIIYGISEGTDKESKHKQIKIEPIDQRKITREWLDQVISSNISPKIHGIEILPFVINSENEVVYVVEIPKSDTAHQAKDKKYYKRNNTTTDAMEDYEIRDVMGRNKSPKIELYFYFYIDKYFNKGEITYTLNIKAKNVGSVYAMYVNGIFYIPSYLIDYDEIKENELYNENGINYYIDYEYNTKQEIISYNGNRPIFSPVRYDPILPSLTRTWEIPIKNLSEVIPSGSFKSHEKLKWTIHADNAIPVSGEVFLNSIEIVIAKEPIQN